MLKKSFLVLLIAIISVCANGQEGWFPQKIRDRVTVTFPYQAQKINEQNFGVKAEDGTIYLVSFVDLLKATEMSLAAFNQDVVTQKFADEFLAGLAPTMAKYTFKPAKIIKVKDNNAYQIVGRDEVNKSTISMNIVFVDGYAYSITHIMTDGKEIRFKDIFLNNISVTK